MRRVFYIALGATAGVLVVRRLSQVAQKWSPEGLAGQAGGLGQRVQEFFAEVAENAAEREAELREALGLDDVAGEADAVHR
jgi:hypothetical protein